MSIYQICKLRDLEAFKYEMLFKDKGFTLT